MLCPECAEDTNPTLKYCQFCNSVLDFDFERVGAALAYEAEEAVTQRVTEKVQGYLYLALYIFVVVIIVRIMVSKPVKIEHSPGYYVPASLAAETKSKEAVPLELRKVPLPK